MTWDQQIGRESAAVSLVEEVEGALLTDAAAGFAGDGGASSDLGGWPMPEPLDKGAMAAGPL